MSKYLELPWSVEDTIENLKELKDGLQEKCIIQNLHGRGEKDAEEIAFDFDRATTALEEIQKYRAIGTPDECRAAVEKQKEIRNKAIDDFAEACKQNIMCQTVGLHPRNVDEIAKQLKAGDSD